MYVGDVLKTISIKKLYYKSPMILRVLIGVIGLMCLFGLAIHLVEPDRFPTIFDGVWWSFVTAATVGYGDYVPLTTEGKLIGILLILSGGGLIAYYVTVLSASTLRHERELGRGRIAFKGKNHIICIGWNERTKTMLTMLRENEPKSQIVIIDKTTNYIRPYEEDVHFIHGDSSSEITLEKAGIHSAKAILISSQSVKGARHADIETILTTIAIKAMVENDDLPIIVEMHSEQQIMHVKRAGASIILQTNRYVGTLFYHALSSTVKDKPYNLLGELLNQQVFQIIDIPSFLSQENFQQICTHFLQENRLVIGIIKDGKVILNPDQHLNISQNDQLISLFSND